MYRNVYRRDVHLNDALNLALADVGECDVISVKEGKARVIVLEIAGLPHSGRILVDEAEDAFVLAGLLFVHKRGCKFKTDIKIVFFLAEAEILSDTVGEYPLVLLDDVFSELDTGRRNYITGKIVGKQVIITSCDPIPMLTDSNLIFVENGSVHSVPV